MHHPLTVRDFQKFTPEEYRAYKDKMESNWERAVTINKIQAYCDKLGIPSGPMIIAFYTPTVPPGEPKTCKGRVKSSGKKCFREARPGCEYCGLHKRHEKKRRPKPPPPPLLVCQNPPTQHIVIP